MRLAVRGRMYNTGGGVGGIRFVSKGEQEAGEMKEDFVQAEQYDGFREGYVFKKGSQGLGCGFPSPALCLCTIPAVQGDARRRCTARCTAGQCSEKRLCAQAHVHHVHVRTFTTFTGARVVNVRAFTTLASVCRAPASTSSPLCCPPSRYYRDRGPKGPWDPFDVNTGVIVRDREYDMDKHVNPQPGLRGLVAWPKTEKRLCARAHVW